MINESTNPIESVETVNILTTASGELRNMLSVLKMASDLLMPTIENLGNPRLNGYTAMIYHCFYNMLRLTDNLGDLGAIMRDDMPISLSSYDIVAETRELVRTVGHLVGDKGAQIRFESNEESLIIYADRYRLDKMLLNLISNSLQNTQQGGQVSISVVAVADRTVLSVSDNGSGIPGEILQTAWNMYRVPQEIPGQQGIGLGLTIVQNIAQMHGGSAVLESKQGGGTTVTVSLPIIKPTVGDLRTSASGNDSASMQQLLTELSGVIGYEKYSQLYMD